jgi:hypothetical protein
MPHRLGLTGRLLKLIAKRSAPVFPRGSAATTEAAIDEAFAKMTDDADYQRDSMKLAREFETSDWEAFKSATNASQAGSTAQ